jgi:hypothetical protein
MSGGGREGRVEMLQNYTIYGDDTFFFLFLFLIFIHLISYSPSTPSTPSIPYLLEYIYSKKIVK